MSNKYIWSEHYRPSKVVDYVFMNEDHENKVKSWVEEGHVPHLLLSGPAGTGKTSLAMLLMSELEVDDADILYINASVDNGVEYIRNAVVGFSQTIPFGECKYVILDEADYLTTNGQAALRGVMQEYAEYTRFILTCNYVAKIMEPIVSRCFHMPIDKMDVKTFTYRFVTILGSEGVTDGLELDVVDEYVKNTYPDLRKCINNAQGNIVDGKLKPYTATSSTCDSVMIEAVNSFIEGDIEGCRKHICANISPDQFVDTYRFLYNNVALFTDDKMKGLEVLVAVKNGLIAHGTSADAEICLSGTIAKIALIVM